SGRHALLHLSQARQDPPVAERADGCLTGAFRSGFCIGHWKSEISERGGSWRAATVSRPRSHAAEGGIKRFDRSEADPPASRFCAQFRQAFPWEYRSRRLVPAPAWVTPG